MWIKRFRLSIITFFILLTAISVLYLPSLKFTFDFEQFFPDNDPDLEYYKEFIQEFESDDNYLLIALECKNGIDNRTFLAQVDSFTKDLGNLKGIVGAFSIPTLLRPISGPTGISLAPVLRYQDSILLSKDMEALNKEGSFFKKLIASDGLSLLVILRVPDHIEISSSKVLIRSIQKVIEAYSFDAHHILGRAYFQDQLSTLQVQEVLYSSIGSIALVSLILFLIYRNRLLVFIILVSITAGLIIFLGILSLLGRELNAISALYPVLMLIVGTSDVVHILSKYLDELRKGNTVFLALDTAFKQIGLATLLTSATTAIGFFSLISSRIGPVRAFGMNAALGVMVAFITILLFTTSLVSFLNPETILAKSKHFRFWGILSDWFYKISKNHSIIYSIFFTLVIICLAGILNINTDYSIHSTLPKQKKVTTDFHFFEDFYSGYRPLEFAFYKKDEEKILDPISFLTIRKIEEEILASPHVENSVSVVGIWDMISEHFPRKSEEDESDYFIRILPYFNTAVSMAPDVLLNKQKTKARISAKIKDVGANTIQKYISDLNHWINLNVDTSTYFIRYTGTGVVLDKNAAYVREGLKNGLGFALVIIGLLMGFLFRNVKLLFISLIPNSIPLLFAGAILGFGGIPLEPVTSITFAVIFGIAVDDTIHFLSRYRLALHSGLGVEEAIKVSFDESGKAIIITTIILFFGFLIMLFSYNPPSVIVGGLISITLLCAIFADLILLPVLLRTFQIK